jgi:hypothetical protein
LVIIGEAGNLGRNAIIGQTAEYNRRADAWYGTPVVIMTTGHKNYGTEYLAKPSDDYKKPLVKIK